MESSPSFSGHSEAPPLSEDSGLLITSGSVSSDSVSGWLHITSELQESDYDDKSLSLYDCQETSELMCGDNFNTVKKGPTKVLISAIDPPPQFQDSPILSKQSQTEWECVSLKEGEGGTRRGARSALRLSCSHSSLATPAPSDDSSFITQAISHHTLPTTATASDIADMYNVPFDSDIYAIPIDMVRPRHQAKRSQRSYRKRGRSVCQPVSNPTISERYVSKVSKGCDRVSGLASETDSKRHSVPSTSINKKCISATSIGQERESMHMTLHEVRKYLHTLYSSSSESETHVNLVDQAGKSKLKSVNIDNNNSFKYKSLEGNLDTVSKLHGNDSNNICKSNKNDFVINIKNKKVKETFSPKLTAEETKEEKNRLKKSQSKSLSSNFKQTLCSLLGLGSRARERAVCNRAPPPVPLLTATRALPPLPCSFPRSEEPPIDFTTSIQKVKDYGWYWGPISGPSAERILSDEPDGSFIVRDSSDDHYIFTLTFKLNGMRHVRIEHDQGNFCFGNCTMFKAQTIVEFIENAVETSRSGQYLFFLNLRPIQGPMRVQLLYPVSRFKMVQSLQHMCRFVILKVVRKDLIGGLPLPRRLLDYLSTPHYYSELMADW